MTPERGGARFAEWCAFWVRIGAGSAGFVMASVWYVLLLAVGVAQAARREAFARTMSRLVLRPLGIRVRHRGLEHLASVPQCVFACNHQSQADYPIGATIFPRNAVVLASQIEHWPLLGMLYRSSGSLVVDKHIPHRALAALKIAEEAVRTGGHSVWFFVEGTRGSKPGALGPFKRGAFWLSTRTGIPVVPVVISPLKPWTDLRGRRLSPHEVTLTVLAPIFPTGTTREDENALHDAVRAGMERTQLEFARGEAERCAD